MPCKLHSSVCRLALLCLLQVLPLLQARFPIQRARMRLKLQVPEQHQQALLDALDAAGSVVEGIEQAGSAAVVVTQVTGVGR